MCWWVFLALPSLRIGEAAHPGPCGFDDPDYDCGVADPDCSQCAWGASAWAEPPLVSEALAGPPAACGEGPVAAASPSAEPLELAAHAAGAAAGAAPSASGAGAATEVTAARRPIALWPALFGEGQPANVQLAQAGLREARARGAQRQFKEAGVSLYYANVTSWSAKAQDYIQHEVRARCLGGC